VGEWCLSAKWVVPKSEPAARASLAAAMPWSDQVGADQKFLWALGRNLENLHGLGMCACACVCHGRQDGLFFFSSFSTSDGSRQQRRRPAHAHDNLPPQCRSTACASVGPMLNTMAGGRLEVSICLSTIQHFGSGESRSRASEHCMAYATCELRWFCCCSRASSCLLRAHSP
jgi:hypothetical protein